VEGGAFAGEIFDAEIIGKDEEDVGLVRRGDGKRKD
jgi:hypothetical protein